MALCGFEAILFSSLSLFQCNPLDKAWRFEKSGKCLNIVGIFTAATSFSLATNLFTLLLPMPMIWRLHMTLRRRLSLLGIFAIGVM